MSTPAQKIAEIEAEVYNLWGRLSNSVLQLTDLFSWHFADGSDAEK
jgi:hypothetical protein